MTHFKTPFIFKLVPWIIGLTFLIIIVYWAVIGAITFFAANQASQMDFSGGIKPIIETVWCGSAGCMDEK